MLKSMLTGVLVVMLAVAMVATPTAQVRDQRTPVPPDKPATKGVIGGVVLSADSGRPVRRARVRVCRFIVVALELFPG